MKNLIFIIAAGMLFSCAKEQCWECETSTWDEIQGIKKETKVRCGYTWREIRRAEKSETCEYTHSDGHRSGETLECKKLN